MGRGEDMVAFKKMWDDVLRLFQNEEKLNYHIIKTYDEGFIIGEKEDTTFVTKKDFIDFWCKMLYFNEISREQIKEEDNGNMTYIYDIIKNLPYVSEVRGVLRIVEE